MMAKRASSASSAFRLLSPSYYLRKTHRLVLLCLFFIGILFIGLDRQNIYRERELQERRLQELEVEREKLAYELSKLKVNGVPDSVDPTIKGGAEATRDSKHLRGGNKQQPLILGVETGEQRGPRKVLPKDKKQPVAVDAGKNQEKSMSEVAAKTARQKVSTDPEEAKTKERRESVRQGMIHAWASYEQYAWGNDELQPQSKNGVNHFGGLGATIVDSLDTLYIMGLQDQFEKAKQWTFENMHFDKDYDASVFETTIRVMGGLLSAFDLSGDEGFLKKAKELADQLLPAWNTQSGMPWTFLNLHSGHGNHPGWTGSVGILADSGTTTMEMVALSQRIGDAKYGDKAERVIQLITQHFPEDGLVPIYVNQDGGPANDMVSFGAMGDSFYEYLLKVWVQLGKTKAVQHYRELWDKSMKGMMTLVRKTKASGFTYLAEKSGGNVIAKMDHLACFAAGMLVLGAEGPHADEYLQLAKELGRTCYAFYDRMPSKLSGEHYLFNDETDLQVGHSYNIGRPETVESLFYLWRKTHDPIYRDWGWNIWQAFEKQCRLPSGYTGLRDVNQEPPEKDDMMQSFFVAETLKYLYLLFSPDDVIPLDKWVFNTEAHPVKIIPRTVPGQVKFGTDSKAVMQGQEQKLEVGRGRIN